MVKNERKTLETLVNYNYHISKILIIIFTCYAFYFSFNATYNENDIIITLIYAAIYTLMWPFAYIFSFPTDIILKIGTFFLIFEIILIFILFLFLLAKYEDED